MQTVILTFLVVLVSGVSAAVVDSVRPPEFPQIIWLVGLVGGAVAMRVGA